MHKHTLFLSIMFCTIVTAVNASDKPSQHQTIKHEGKDFSFLYKTDNYRVYYRPVYKLLGMTLRREILQVPTEFKTETIQTSLELTDVGTISTIAVSTGTILATVLAKAYWNEQNG